MPELVNSQRRINTFTYSPVQPKNTPEDIEQGKQVQRSWTKTSFIRSLAIREPEIALLRKRVQDMLGDDQKKAQVLSTLDVVTRMVSDTSPARTQANAPILAKVDHRMLVEVGQMLVESRHNLAQQVENTLESVRANYTTAMRQSADAVVATSTIDGSIPPPEGASGLDLDVGSAFEPQVKEVVASRLVATSRAEGVPALEDAVEWSAIYDTRRFKRLISLAESFTPVAPIYSRLSPGTKVAALLPKMFAWAKWTGDVVDGFTEQMKVEPIGRLHLERLQMTPVGIEHGELVYSLPLAPKETVNISHKEWALHSEEFEKIVQDQFEQFSEQGVTEKNDLSQNTTSQSTHAQALTLSASGSYYGISASVGYNSSSGEAQTQADSRNRSIDLTRKASSRARKDHKFSFKVSAVAGTEDQAVRVITNPSETSAMRVDYYQLMRKWRVDLYRYDLRLTYDITIPNPSAELIHQIEEVYSLDKLIDRPFEFPLALSLVTPSKWTTYAALYSANVEPPPSLKQVMQEHKEYTDQTRVFFDALEFRVDPDYIIKQAALQARFDPDNDKKDDAYFDLLHDDGVPAAKFREEVDKVEEAKLIYRSKLPHLKGKTGELVVIYTGQELREGSVFLELILELKPEALERWQFKAWSAMREAAEEKYFQDRQALIERRTKLVEELSKWDALTLRQMEREAVMKGVLHWLFGPEFDFVPPNVRSLFDPSDPNDPASLDVLDPSNLSNQEWGRVLAWGEFIKFIHQAVEWENVLYFIYPYFWDSPKNWDLKRFLDHPDALHRTFLRAGSARVVLTIRPGFEESFTALIETGAFGELSPDHPYRKITDEIKSFAQTNYPGIPPANLENSNNDGEVVEKEQGILIGRWYEYTPTSALDISIDTALTNLA